ncbi:MAG: aromatic hydrocarbon degradation protein [Chlorobiaceae bacterium]|nr:aromatic hydrocarbon degradation protein [Chlorobiaceae bacterium]
MIRKTACSVAALFALAGTSTVFATNGMNLEGYGSKSMAMGGTGSAFDTGNSAVMNNPATLGFMKEGASEIGLSIRGLHPDVNLSKGTLSDNSNATAFYMPSMSYMRREGDLSWGAALFAQGGMGTDYGNNSSLFARGYSMANALIDMSGEDIRSEVSVGRIMFPVAWHLSSDTVIGASFDVVIASMDLQMDLDGQHFANMMAGNGGSVSGSMRTSLESMMMPASGPMITGINYARFDFSNNSQWIGEAVGLGTGLKFGITHKVNKSLTVGASYHSQTRLADLETGKATLSFNGDGPAFTGGPVAITGTIKVRNFEWPATVAAGFAVNPSDKLLIAGDVKVIDWSAVMSKFSTTFIADASNPGFGGQELDVDMTQSWKDQTVWSLGMQYMATKKLALRAGASFSANPIPDSYLNPLFPAITKNHYTCGFGYRVNEKTSVAAAFSLVPKITATNADGVENAHSQRNWSLSYTLSL